MSALSYADMRKPGEGASLDKRVRWMCGHSTCGGQYRQVPGLRPIAWRCIDCVKAADAKKGAA
jgi:hypothetical protein